MITLRPANERGHANYGWLDTHHSFSFANYYDPAHMGFRALRVINEDRVSGGAGFDTHPHRDMEIVTYILSGALQHRDSMGNTATIQAGEVQRITAGTGIFHSEFNASDIEPVHLLQIWLLPNQKGLTPGYEEKILPVEDRFNRWQQVASQTGENGSITIHQDIELYSTILSAGHSLSYALQPGRHAWLQVARGKLSLNGVSLEAGDGVAISDETQLDLQVHQDEAEVLLFDLA